jgi:hypothetical protein
LLQPKLPHRLQHGEARGHRIRARLADDQALLDQGIEPGEHIRERQPADRCRGLQRPATGEDSEGAEDGLLLRREQRMAPANRVPQRLLASRCIARSWPEYLEALAEECHHRRR